MGALAYKAEPLPARAAAAAAGRGFVRRAGDAHVHVVVVTEAVARLEHHGFGARHELIRFAERARVVDQQGLDFMAHEHELHADVR